MARKRILLHVGCHKTGTTFVQNALAAGAALLQQHGVLVYQDPVYAPRGYGEHALALAVRTTPHADLPLAEDRDAIWDRFVRAADGFAGDTVVNSSEVFLEKVDRDYVRRRLEAFDLRLLFFVREQVDMLGALYAEVVKHGLHKTVDAYYEEAREDRLDYFAELERWAAVFGRERLVVRDYGRIRRAGGLLREVLLLAGLPAAVAAALPRPAGVANGRQPAAVVEALRAYNALPLPAAEKLAFRERLGALVAERPEIRALPPFRIGEPLASRVRADSRASNARLSAVYGEPGRPFFADD